jgi:hypothetical protein
VRTTRTTQHLILINVTQYLHTIALALVLSLPASAVAQSTDLLASLKPSHPRILIEPGQFSALKAQAEVDPLLTLMLHQLLAEAQQLMEQPLLQRQQEGRRLLAVSRAAFHRISIWAMARHLEDDPRYAQRAEQEMLQLVQFSDWNPSHFLDVAEMTAALAIGYDWLYDDLDAEARKTIREGIIRLGLSPGLKAIRNDAWWATRDNNWNQVCLGGLTMGALAVADESPAIASELLEAARSGISNGLSVYAPDGVYPEGPGYWAYGTVYQCLMIDALRSALGTSWEVENAPGFLQSARAQAQLTGPTGRFFNFSDGREGPSLQAAMFWFARELDEPELLRGQREILKTKLMDQNSNSSGILPALWWSEKPGESNRVSLPLSWKGGGENSVVTFRSSWSDPDALYLACKGGRGDLSHAHLDAGSFVLEANGIRWAVDLGHQGYHDLESKGISLWDSGQNGRRWDVFRLSNRSHNTLTIDNELHRIDGLAELTHFDSNAAELDLSAVFRGQAEKVQRRFEFSGHDVTMTDHLQGLTPGAQVRWTMATRADVEIKGTQATLRQDGESLKVTMREAEGSRLRVIPADPPDDGFNAPNPGTYLLIVDATAPASGQVLIEMHFQPEEK